MSFGQVTVLAWVLPAAAFLAGCAPTAPAGGALYARLQSDSPFTRARAVVQAAEARDDGAIPYLVDRLTDSERSVRLFAIRSLQKLTGRTFGYRHYDPPDKRQKAVGQWRHWLEQRAATTRPTARLADRRTGTPEP